MALYVSNGASVSAAAVLGRRILRDLFNDTAFRDLLLVEPTTRDRDLGVQRFWHQTLGEFLIADRILEALENGGSDLKALLRVVYHNEVNTFVREALAEKSPAKLSKIFRELAAVYASSLFHVGAVGARAASRLVASRWTLSKPSLSFHGNGDALRVREQALYYIGRLPVGEAPGAEM